MNANVAWMIAEIIKLTVDRLQASGRYETLTEEGAKAMVKEIADSLPLALPTPEQLEEPSV